MAVTQYVSAGIPIAKGGETPAARTAYISAGVSGDVPVLPITGTIAQVSAPATQALTGKLSFKGSIAQVAAPATQALTGDVESLLKGKKLVFNPLSGSFDYVQNLTGYVPYTGAAHRLDLGAKNFITTGTITGGAFVGDLTGNVTGNVTGDLSGNVTATTVDTGTLTLDDNEKIKFGTGDDAELYYDGTDLKLVTDAVAASDFVVDCGTQKTLELAEVVYDDVRTPISTVRLSGSQPPTTTLYKGGEVLAFPHTAAKTIYFNVQLPHSYKEAGNLEFHIHYAIETSGANGVNPENVKWDFTYSWSNMTAAIPDATSDSATIDVKALTSATHYRGQIVASIDGTGKNISSMLICSLTRDVAVANNYAANVYLMEVDFHYPIDTLGSRQAGVK